MIPGVGAHLERGGVAIWRWRVRCPLCGGRVHFHHAGRLLGDPRAYLGTSAAVRSGCRYVLIDKNAQRTAALMRAVRCWRRERFWRPLCLR